LFFVQKFSQKVFVFPEKEYQTGGHLQGILKNIKGCFCKEFNSFCENRKNVVIFAKRK